MEAELESGQRLFHNLFNSACKLTAAAAAKEARFLETLVKVYYAYCTVDTCIKRSVYPVDIKIIFEMIEKVIY